VSGIGEILDRLSGVAVVKEQVAAVKSELARILPLLVDHERRLTRIETRSEPLESHKAMEGLKKRTT
jgi:hypothetical protein